MFDTRPEYTAKNYELQQVVENRIEQCCAAHIVQCCRQYCSASIVTPDCGLDLTSTTCSILLTTINNMDSTRLFNPVFNNS